MGTEPKWGDLIEEAARKRDVSLKARRHVEGLRSATQPQKIVCSDQALYSVKFVQNGHGNGRGTFNEQIVAKAGALIGAPVPEVRLVTVPAAIADDLANRAAALGIGFQPKAGVHHASRWSDGYSDRMEIAYEDENQAGLAALQVMFSWLYCNEDFQLIYADASPHGVLSVDHTEFLPGGRVWSEQTLSTGLGLPLEASQPLGGVRIEAESRADTLVRLGAVDRKAIAGLVAGPPDEWGVSAAEREALASYLEQRQAAVLAHYSPQEDQK